jgi:hypothetical protein
MRLSDALLQGIANPDRPAREGRPTARSSRMTKIVKAYPPNYAAIKARFNPPRGTVFAYGDTIYSPRVGELSADLIAHEEVHFAQQQPRRRP